MQKVEDCHSPTELQRKEKIERERMEALRLDGQREILDMEIKAEEEKKRENKIDELSSLEMSSSLTCNSPYGNLNDILGLNEKLPFLLTNPPHLEIRPVAIVNPPGPPQIKS